MELRMPLATWRLVSGGSRTLDCAGADVGGLPVVAMNAGRCDHISMLAANAAARVRRRGAHAMAPAAPRDND